MTDATDIVACARGWIGTRFHHQGRLKKTPQHKGGVDCLGLLVGIATELDMRLPDGTPAINLDQVDYPHYPDTQLLTQKLAQAMVEVPPTEMRAGDVVLFDIDGMPQHLAIIGDRGEGYGIIHAYAPARAVVEHFMDHFWQKKIAAIFRFNA